jgi:hypothetical protein
MRDFIIRITDKYIIMVIESRMMIWVGHVVHIGKTRNAVKILVGNPEDYLGNPELPNETKRVVCGLDSSDSVQRPL